MRMSFLNNQPPNPSFSPPTQQHKTQQSFRLINFTGTTLIAAEVKMVNCDAVQTGLTNSTLVCNFLFSASLCKITDLQAAH